MEEDTHGNEVEVMKQKGCVRGFWDRLEVSVVRSGLSKAEITRRMGVNRKTIYRSTAENMGALNVAKFCAVTKTDANWLLGLKGSGL
jgi:hypothetical protein